MPGTFVWLLARGRERGLLREERGGKDRKEEADKPKCDDEKLDSSAGTKKKERAEGCWIGRLQVEYLEPLLNHPPPVETLEKWIQQPPFEDAASVPKCPARHNAWIHHSAGERPVP